MDNKTCDLCHNSQGKYVCPKCGILYCSVSCFRSDQHLQCSENFYKKCVEDELKLQQSINCPEEISDILKRNQCRESGYALELDHDIGNDISDVEADDGGDDDDDDDDYYDEDDEVDEVENGETTVLHDLAKRMENVNLDNEKEVWDKLSSSERKEFQNMIRSGGIRNILPEWEPWWMIIQPNPLITELNTQNEDNSHECLCPPLNVEIPPFTELTTKTPAPNIPFMLSNVLMSYAYIARWFKGKHEDMPVEGTTALFTLSSVIRSNKIIHSFFEAFKEFEHDSKNCKWATSDIPASQIRKDLAHIVKGSKGGEQYFSIKACLCDIYNLVVTAMEILKHEPVTHFVASHRFTGSPPSLSEVKLLSKKIIYYLSWTETYGKQLANNWSVLQD